MSRRIVPPTPCPKCEQQKNALVMGNGPYRVYCPHCAHEGPLRRTAKRATEVWRRNNNHWPRLLDGLVLMDYKP